MPDPDIALKDIVPNDAGKKLPKLGQKTPSRFWEIQEFFKCPVVGMCLTMAEQKRLLKKTSVSVKNASAFEIHEALVASSETENRVSRRVDRQLHRKFGKEVQALLRLDHAAFMAHFKAADVAGDHAAALWAAAIHPDLPYKMKREIFGEIHMSMHWSGEERMKMNRKLSCHHRQLEDSRKSGREVAQQKRALEKENARLRRILSGLQDELAAAREEIARMTAVSEVNAAMPENDEPEQIHRHLENELEALYQRFNTQQRQVEALKEKNRKLSAQVKSQQALSHYFRHEAREIMAELASEAKCDESCPSFDLCEKRVLIVGGMSRMASLYRELIEASGGIFEYHDGYMRNGDRQLEGRLKRADVVLCPVSCNSHNACSAVKRLAKKHKKTVHMLSNYSLKAVSQAIWKTAQSQHMVN